MGAQHITLWLHTRLISPTVCTDPMGLSCLARRLWMIGFFILLHHTQSTRSSVCCTPDVCTAPPLCCDEEREYCNRTYCIHDYQTIMAFNSFMGNYPCWNNVWKFVRSGSYRVYLDIRIINKPVNTFNWSSKLQENKERKKKLSHKLCAFRCLEFETSAEVCNLIQINYSS